MSKAQQWIDTHITLHSHDDQREEQLNGWTHVAGAILALAGSIALVVKGYNSNIGNRIWGILIFGITMIITYTGSAAYHFRRPSTLKRILRVLDHSNIYLLIAGTYTPLCYLLPPDPGILILISEWSLVLIGICFTLFFWGRLKPLHLVFYLAMGWLVMLFWQNLQNSIPTRLLYWILAGGVTYTIGVIFYALKRLPHYHAIWHVFVIGGSLCFFMGMYIHGM